MECEVALVGAGIGGLTTAALLAKRGVDVCVFERSSVVGGCVANFEKFGYTFEPTYGLYASWGADQIYDRLFTELGIAAPESQRLEPAYVVRLPDRCDVAIGSSDFDEQLRTAFPECAEQSVAFYHSLKRSSEDAPASRWRRIFAPLSTNKPEPFEYKLAGLSPRFKQFINAQLQAFGQVNTTETSYRFAAEALRAPREGLFAVKGGAAALANSLAQAITVNGGKIRLNTPVLRLANASDGRATGLDLLSGERVTASRAIVSNLTIWDTYGKLVGLNRTPGDIRKQLNSLRSHGSYLVFAGMDELAVKRLPAEHILITTRSIELDNAHSQIMFAAAPAWDARAPAGKRAVVIHQFTDVDDWFTFHTDETEEEQTDQRALEQLWSDLHTAAPELGDSIEAIDTATPRTFYENTRRKLGMVGGVAAQAGSVFDCETFLPNLFITSDTVAPGGLHTLVRQASELAELLINK